MKSIQLGFYLLRFAIKFWIICNVFAYVSYIISILMSSRVDSATLRQNQNFIVNNFYDPYVIIDANVPCFTFLAYRLRGKKATICRLTTA